MPELVERLQPFRTTIFAEMTELAVRHHAVNLGQGFPDTDGPAAMLAEACRAINGGVNQYSPGAGMPVLRQAVAADRQTRYGTAYDPDTEVLVTVGATEAISSALLGLVEPGDEVVLVEPYYDSYAASVALAGGVRRVVPLVASGGEFRLDVARLREAVTPKTRMIVVNSPHNPTGSVLTDEELAAVAQVAVANDTLVLADEVYEHLVFDGRAHTPICTLPGMRERTLTASSASKTFNVTGWKTGWLVDPAELVAAARAAKQYMSFVGAAPFQPAVALALRTEQDWVVRLRADLQAKRDTLSGVLREVGFEVFASEGTYFVVADPRPLGYDDGAAFCRDLPGRVGVAAVPISAFVDNDGPWRHLVRFAFCKSDAAFAEAAHRLGRLRGA